ncbi:hypothetical protein FEM48_Zijuj11G0086500 [Ziziphus jujuba var. spinosa]|uniref:Uncharacterized protein n=1 Tax=Ziziphus jujuba var. spinosa TaxID=714518 RepID=A0A978UHX7_ZIZJJ|nr:hypothetical protein FEM48_Zijuj11G0086500 [Ziziphus jujuba var. spinosa]
MDPLKLTADNHIAWHARWYSLLIGYDLMGYVTGTSIYPTSDLGKNLSIRQDHLLRSALLASLDPTIVNFVASNESSSEAWQNLATILADCLALAGEPLGKDEITFHFLNGLGPEYKEFFAAIWVRDPSITFAELHDKLANYEAFLNGNHSTTSYVSPVTANCASCGGNSSIHTRKHYYSVFFYQQGYKLIQHSHYLSIL